MIEGKKNNNNKRGKQKKGLACVLKKMRARVARESELGLHSNGGGIACCSLEVRRRIVSIAGRARARNNRDSLIEASKKAGATTLDRYGVEFFRKNGKEGRKEDCY